MNDKALALTPGEPAGIGPDVMVELAQREHALPLVVYADPDLLQSRAIQLDLPLTLHPLDAFAGDMLPELSCLPASALYIRSFPVERNVVPGKLDMSNAPYVVACLEAATQDCLQFSRQLALVTGPVQKSVMNDAGISFSGHTEYLQALAKVDKVVMMLATRMLRVALVTTHLPLRDVPSAITQDAVRRTLEIVEHDVRRFFTVHSPSMLVCGLNPHAGEGGHLGVEERDVIEPVLLELVQRGMTVIGPVPADTAFTSERLRNVDVVVAMYHDQGLPVLKAQGFGEAINVTLGLPFVRTSVDHGTALTLAGTGGADVGSLQYAVETAGSMLQRMK
jgi:4-hydroxythreonine-4-phosphate dehydrogenase